MSWTLATSQDWNLIAIEVRPPQRLSIDAEAGIIPDPTWINARNYPSLQAAVDAAPTGGSVFIPAGDYRVASGGLVISRKLALCGEPGTRLFANSVAAGQPVIKLDPLSTILAGVQLRDLTLQNDSLPSGALSGNYGLQCDVGSTGGKVAELVLERVTVLNMGDDGIHLHALGVNDSYFVFVTLRNVQVRVCRWRGLYVRFANLLSAYDCYFNGNDDCGVKVEDSEPLFRGCAFEYNCLSAAMDPVRGGQAYVKACPMSRFDGCHWEEFTGDAQPTNKRALTIENSPCCTVGNSWFVNAVENNEAPGQRGIYCTYSDTPGPGGVMGCVIFPNRFHNVKTAIEVDGTESPALDCVVFPQFIDAGTGAMMLPTNVSNSGLVVLGNRPSSGLTRGIALPALQSALPPGRPTLGAADAGYIMFDTDEKRLIYWDGTTWRLVATAP